jgi:hypothetical protein
VARLGFYTLHRIMQRESECAHAAMHNGLI